MKCSLRFIVYNTYWVKNTKQNKLFNTHYLIINVPFSCPRDRRSGGILFLSCLSFCPPLWNFNLPNNFWTVSARALIFHMSILSVISLLLTLTLEFDPFFENFNLANNFWTMSARALIFNMSIPCDEIFLWVPLFFTLWPWPWSLTHISKTLTFLIIFELWVLELWYFLWVFLVMRPFCGFHYFWPCDLDQRVWPPF